MVNPCGDCPNKGCGTFHDKCTAYQNYRKENEMMNKERGKQNNLYGTYVNEATAKSRSNHMFRSHKK